MNTSLTEQPLAYWRCHSELPYGVQIGSTVVSVLLSLLIVNSAFGITFSYSNLSLKGMFNKVEKRAIIIQYLIAMPLFEIFVIWGPDWTDGIAHNSTSSVVSWLAVNCLSVILVIVAFFSLQRYRMLIHVAQCMRAPTAVMFFSDRLINFSIGVEGVFIGAVFVTSMFELFHVHRFLSPSRRQPMPLDIAPDPAPAPVPLVTPTTPTHESERRRPAEAEEVVFKDNGPQSPKQKHEYDESVPLSVQHQLYAQQRHKVAANTLKSLTNLKGNESARTLKRMVAPLRDIQTAGQSVSSGSQSERAKAAEDDDTALSDF
jgi:hypothetical protein